MKTPPKNENVDAQALLQQLGDLWQQGSQLDLHAFLKAAGVDPGAIAAAAAAVLAAD
jgi:hypothetical protein